MLVSERVGQFFFDSGAGQERLEYTEYGAGPHWVVLLHGQLMPRWPGRWPRRDCTW
jgi:hypothetical protein